MHETIQPVAEAKRRAREYWEMDGIPTLVLGLIIFFIGTQERIDAWFEAKVPSASLAVGLALAFACLWLCVKQDKIIDWAKARVTYPRTGYAARPGSAGKNDPDSPSSPTWTPEKRKIAFAFIAFGISLITLFIMAGLYPAQAKWIIASAGLLPLFFALPMGSGVKRRPSLASWILGLGTSAVWAAAWLLSKSGSRSNSSLAVLGVWFFAVGTFRLIFYLHRNPVART